MALELESLGELLDKLTYARLRKRIQGEWLDKQLDEAILRIVNNVAHKVIANIITKNSKSTTDYIAQQVVKRMSRPGLNKLIDDAIATAAASAGDGLKKMVEESIASAVNEAVAREVRLKLRPATRSEVAALIDGSMEANSYSVTQSLFDSLDDDDQSEEASEASASGDPES